MKQAKGQIKETTGKVTGNKTLETKGRIEKAVGKGQTGLGKAQK